ncbi:SMI1/KNR4 family protein [Streptomyces sp900116325]|uniref:SMI1/KNR4 family protein n=1 Tax=Streptomyces sp. 900116325 TaxID=3154295 RepID=UPI0033ECFD65
MTTDWMAEAQRIARGRRLEELSCPPSEQDACPAPPLSEAEIREAEAELGIAFPDQYREYLLRHSPDGAVNRLRRSAAGWGWHGDSSTNYDLLTTAFPAGLLPCLRG